MLFFFFLKKCYFKFVDIFYDVIDQYYVIKYNFLKKLKVFNYFLKIKVIFKKLYKIYYFLREIYVIEREF